jgi:hypothetical protein
MAIEAPAMTRPPPAPSLRSPIDEAARLIAGRLITLGQDFPDLTPRARRRSVLRGLRIAAAELVARWTARRMSAASPPKTMWFGLLVHKGKPR